MKPNEQKITKEFCQGKILLFYPKTEEEAAFIQRKLFEMGFKWGDGDTVVAETANCVSQGIFLKEGLFKYNPNPEKWNNGLLCSSDQFGENYLSPEQAFILEQFNKLAARIDKLEEYLKPKELDKPVLKKPGNGSP